MIGNCPRGGVGFGLVGGELQGIYIDMTLGNIHMGKFGVSCIGTRSGLPNPARGLPPPPRPAGPRRYPTPACFPCPYSAASYVILTLRHIMHS